ncbi:MAG TPA: tetratricopeptide repeat protein, partial [Ktedonobacterales bacterium]|nr:tetratricopeptide repeat protein [Ktedonobacterales bacterium]
LDQAARATVPSVNPPAPPVHVCATVQTIDPDKSPAGSAAQMWGRFLLDANLSPDELAHLPPPSVDHPAARLTREFARGLVAARSGSLPSAREALASVHEAREAVEAMREGKEDRNGTQRGVILEDELRAAIMAAEGKNVEAVALLRQAAAAEESLPMAFGPPFVDKPAHELLGEVLLEMGRPAEARVAFETAVARAPNRTRSVDGLHRCAAATPGNLSVPAGGQAGATTPGR